MRLAALRAGLARDLSALWPALLAARVAVLAGWVAAEGGLLISYHFNTAAGASIAGLSVVLFFIALAVRELAASIGRRSNDAGPDTHPTHAPGRIHAGHHH